MSEYSNIQKTFLSLVIVPCLVECIVIYRYAKKRLMGESDKQARRMERFYAILAGSTMGQFFCHTLKKGLIDTGVLTLNENAWGYQILIGFVLLSFFLLYAVDKYSLVWNDNPFHLVNSTLNQNALSTEDLLDRNTVEEARYHESSDVTTETHAIRSFNTLDSRRMVTVYRRRAILLFILMILLVMIEGMYLVYRQNKAVGGPGTLVAIYWIDKIMETLVVTTILIHGHVHALENEQHRWFWVLCLIWCFTVLFSTIPVLNGVTTEQIASWVEFPGMGILHAAIGGVLFYISIYFTFLDRPQTDGRDMCIRIFLWLGACMIAYITGIFV